MPFLMLPRKPETPPTGSSEYHLTTHIVKGKLISSVHVLIYNVYLLRSFTFIVVNVVKYFYTL